MTSLHIAVLNGYTEMVSLLLSRGANINAEDIIGRIPSYLAVEQKRRDILRLFLDTDNYHSKYVALLYNDIRVKDIDTANFLINSGINTDGYQS